MTEALEPDVMQEALELTAALRAHLELLSMTGAVGLPRSEGPIAASLSEPPPSLVPSAPRPSVPRAALAAPAVPDWLKAATSEPETVASSPVPAEGRSQPVVARAVPVLPEARRARLLELEQSIRGCERCGLCQGRTQTVFARGNGSSRLCFVGEGPGADEDQQGYPFVGLAGQLLDKMIAAMGLARDEVYVCNIVKCRPPNNRKPEPTEMRACFPYLEEQLELVEPEVIVALGATALEGLLGLSGGITRLRGKWKLYQGRIAVMPTFHPAYLLRTPSAKHVVWEDMLAVLKHLGLPVPERGRKPQQ